MSGGLPDRERALALLNEWVANVNLRRHCHAVEAAMRAYAPRYGENPERWALTGLIHDFDWERHPDRERHPAAGVAVLREHGWPEDICRAVLGHASYTGVPRDTVMARALFACDELSGFLVACALMTPNKRLDEVEVPSVRKKMKRVDFARNVNRDDIVNGAAELGVDLDEHIAFVRDAMRGIHADLGL
ncbi:MAG TPA: HD domain-containing protein [Dongiaceae bacterium]|nr:HD domain-containing protein [Dongiaceae bacterium]